MIAEVFHECGAPQGLLNVLHGLGAEVGAPMVSHRTVKAISFTGGTSTGAQVAVTAAQRFAKASLELGGKNASIIFADKLKDSKGEICEEKLDTVAKAITRIAFLNSGQVCLCGSRILVEESVKEVFQERLIYHVQQLKVGDPLQPDTDIGPVSSEAHRNKVQSYIDLGISEGGQILCGGGVPAHMQTGAFLSPTLIGGLKTDCRTATEEIFGPVATIHSFSSEQDAVNIANCTDYGLSASVWTDDLERAHRVSRNLEVGMVWVNTWLHRDLRTAFGGVKDSGLGREGGNYSLDFFSEKKNICIALNQSSPPMPGNMK
jgi:aminomuconate-semialdehyde/2-hydroxymuconate-6-semialdehyde dehydrogenase